MIAAIYARKSTDQSGVADEQKSVARQVEHARHFALRNGWTVDEALIYTDDGISGAEFDKRPGFVRLLNALAPRVPFQMLIVSELSRLGREQLETGYAVKQLSQAGVKIFSYLDGRELLLETPTDKFLMAAVSFAAEIERDKGRQRTRDAMVRKAHAGHVTGGTCFGYRNVEVVGPDGRRSHVEREVLPAEAEIIRQIFRLSAEGYGMKAIAKRLNAEDAPSPRAQQSRSRSWAPTSVREVLFRPLYRGEIVWAQTAKRDRWGQKRQSARPETEWIRRSAPALRIVTDEEWQAAHRRLDAARSLYMEATSGRPFGRPALGNPSKYLLTNLACCYRCGGPLQACSRSHGRVRRRFYGCSAYHDRGRTVCPNGRDVPMADADDVLIEALLDDVLDESILSDAVDEALRLLETDTEWAERAAHLTAQIAAVERERAKLVSAISAGDVKVGVVEVLRALEARSESLQAERRALDGRGRDMPSATQLRADLMNLAHSWRRVLAEDSTNARPIVSSLLLGRITYTPLEDGRWKLTGEATLSGLFSRVFSVGVASPTGFEPVFWP
jgi:site-specific DNA recombinase